MHKRLLSYLFSKFLQSSLAQILLKEIHSCLVIPGISCIRLRYTPEMFPHIPQLKCGGYIPFNLNVKAMEFSKSKLKCTSRVAKETWMKELTFGLKKKKKKKKSLASGAFPI